MLPPGLGDGLPQDRLVFFVRDVVCQLDLSAVLAAHEPARGAIPPATRG